MLKKKENKISVIVPVYNTEEFLEKCLNSIINQSFKEIEIVVINDGSTDDSESIINEFIKKDNRIKYFYEKNSGQAVARNYGISKSASEFIMFVDSDDYIENDMIEKLYDVVLKEKSDIVLCNILSSRNEVTDYSFNNINEFIIKDCGPCAKLIRKELITKNGLFFPDLRAYEDIAVVPSYYLFTDKIGIVNENLYNYYIREGSVMNQLVYSDKLECIFPSLENLNKLFTKSGNVKKFYSELEWIYIRHLLHAASLRFFKFDNYKDKLDKINNIMYSNYPSWMKNKYFRNQGIKYKIVCLLFYKSKYKILKMILKR